MAAVVAVAALGCGGASGKSEAPEAPPPSAVASTLPPLPPVSGGAQWTNRKTKQSWVARSNENTKLLLTVISKYAPETAARFGVDGLDDQIIDLNLGHESNERNAYRTISEELGRRMATESDPLVKQDLAILRASAALAIKRSEVEEKNLVPYRNPTEIVFDSALGLLDDQIVPARRPAIVARLRKYAGMEGTGGQPIVELIKAEIVEGMKHPELAMPAKIEVEKHLGNNATMREGLAKLLQKYEIKNYEEPLKVLTEQLTKFDEFVKTTVLPKARANFVLPPPVYAVALEGYGVDMPPAQLTAMAHEGFNKIQAEMKVVAAEVAKAKNLPNNDYREVIKALKKEQLTGDAILQHYKDRLAEIEAIIRREKLVTLPSRPARIRLGTPAENAQMPAPHMNPPRLLGNTGEQGEFVLPLEVPPAKGAPPKGAEAKLDDFTFAAASWTLTAHEARPGHEMQFAAMVERGVSNARAIYAFNSANVEGWGLYSEAITYPFMPPEGKLISLQLRLQRAVRAFIDPELQQGKWTFDTAKAYLMKEVGLSPAFAKSEVERYTFRSPGQATSYYYGYTKLDALRQELETKLGPKFDTTKFHDFILAQGLLPPDLMREAALKEFK